MWGAMIMTDELRGTGRTWRLINDARDGDVLLIHAWRERDHIREMLHRMGRHHDAVRLLVFEPGVIERLYGIQNDRRIYLDHAIAEFFNPRWKYNELMDQLFNLCVARGISLLREPCNTVSQGSPPGHAAGAGGSRGA